jgi:hypothetical protein
VIHDLIEYARGNWEHWLDEPAPVTIRHVSLRGGPAHTERGMVMLFGNGVSRPELVLKIAFSDPESQFLHTEYENLSKLYPDAPPPIRDGLPRPLAWKALGSCHVMAMSAVRGRRLLHPHLQSVKSTLAKRALESFFRRTFKWSKELSEVSGGEARATGSVLAGRVRLFADRFIQAAEDRDRIESFAAYLDSELHGTWSRGWQHCATDITNALLWKRRVRFVDWEHASPLSDPWFDVTYAPLAIARLGMRQEPRRASVEVFCDVLDPDGWIGIRLRSAMEDHWDFPVPLPTGVVLTLMEAALRRKRTSRPETADLAVALLTQRGVRDRLPWLAPVW